MIDTLKENNKHDLQELTDFLPHGSGIDCDYVFEIKKNKKIYIYNSFHAMDNNGFYYGYADFKLVIDRNDLLNFKLNFMGKLAQYINRKNFLRDYLEDIYYNYLSENKTKIENILNNLNE